MSRIVAASSVPMRRSVSSNVMFSSCSPSSAFAAGVKIGSGSFCAFCRPSGNCTPHTAPDAWYSFQPLPAR